MDAVTLALANQYTNSQRIAYEETKTIVLDSDKSVPSPFTDLVGLKVTDYCPGRRILTTPSKPPEGISGDLAHPGFGVGINYDTYNGYLDKACLIVGGHEPELGYMWCPTLFYDPAKYQGLLYVFEETHDLIGLGITFQPGWYAVNTSTFAHERIDITEHPLVDNTDYLANRIVNGAEDYVNDIFPLVETISFTVNERNILIYDSDGSETSLVFPGDASHIVGDESDWDKLGIVSALDCYDGLVRGQNGHRTAVVYREVHPMDPKFLPAMDSITLNGADGKQYRLAVNESGVLAATAME